MKRSLNVIVASQNPIKRLATKDAFKQFTSSKTIVSLAESNITSGVSDQPLSMDEAAHGAINRLRLIKRDVGYDYYVAIEGGAYKVMLQPNYMWFEAACAVVAASDTSFCVGFGPSYPVPPNIAQHLENGLDLNKAMEIETGIVEIRTREGFNGWLTDGLLDRRKGSSQAVLLALCGLKKNQKNG